MIKVSYSVMSDIEAKKCPRFIKYKYVDGIPTQGSLQMEKGKYFEYELLGACRGDKPELPKLKSGGKTEVELTVDSAVAFAKDILDKLGISQYISPETVQVRLETDDRVGHPDLIGKCFIDSSKAAIYDVKYTETAVDDKWNGWGGVESGGDNGSPEYYKSRTQATQYATMYFEKTGIMPRFYFLVFGSWGKDLDGNKKHWCRILQYRLTDATIFDHDNKVMFARNIIGQWENEGYKAKSDFNTCLSCPFRGICDSVVLLPAIEKIDC